MTWNKQLGKDWKGSRPRCVLFMDGERKDVAKRLTDLVRFPGVRVSADDVWMPCGKPVKKEDGSWDKKPAAEARLNQANCLVHPRFRNKLRDWWLCHGGNTPVWDIASTCKVNGKRGLILIEAKAHETELTDPGDCKSKNCKNIEQIRQAISEANCNLQLKTKNPWNLSQYGHYQLSNRFAWSWKLASLGVPVVLVYLGFLNAQDMACDSPIFKSESDWKRILKEYAKNTIDNSCWGKPLCCNDNTPFIPIIRACNQYFDPKNP